MIETDASARAGRETRLECRICWYIYDPAEGDPVEQIQPGTPFAELLEMAGVVKKIKRTSGAGLPLEAGVKDAYFKVLFLDVGLLHAVNGIYSDTV